MTNTHYLTTADIARMRGFGNLKRFVEVMEELSSKGAGVAPLRLIEVTPDGRKVPLDKATLVNMRDLTKA